MAATDSICGDIASGKLTPEKLEYWINRGFSIEEKNADGLTPLAFAAKEGYIPQVKFLLAKGANPNSSSTHNRSPLWYATKLPAGSGGFSIASILLEAGAIPDIAAEDSLGHNPLFNAIAFSGDINLIKLLLKAGASTAFKRSDGKGACELAQDTGNPDIIQLFCGESEPLPDIIDPSSTARALEYLVNHVSYENPSLRRFYPGDPQKALADAAQRGAALAEYLMKVEAVPQKEVATQSAILALYDLVILLDDSMSMKTEEEGKRIPILEMCLRLIARIFSLVAEPARGILGIRFLNSPLAKDNVSEADANKLVEDHHYRGLTPIGSMLRKKILTPFVYNTEMKKPLLIMVISDGEVEGERLGLLPEVIVESINRIKNTTAGKGDASIAYQFSRVGNNEGARVLLQRLDDQENIANYVDTQAVNIDLDKAIERGERTAVLTIVKLMLGAISAIWDDLDPME